MTYQTLLKNQLSDFESCLTNRTRTVNEAVQNRFQVELNDCTGHSGRDVTHLLQVLFLRRL